MALQIFVRSQMTIDITPAWWRGGVYTFADGAAIMLAMRHDDPETGCGKIDIFGIEAKIVDIIVGMDSVKLVLALDMRTTVADVEAQREALVQRFDAMAATNEAWSRQIAMKAQIAEERRMIKREVVNGVQDALSKGRLTVDVRGASAASQS